MANESKNPALLLAGSVALVIASVLLVGVDYSETRSRASLVPLNQQRIAAIEISMRQASIDQTAATKELRVAVQELRETIARLRPKNHE